MILLLSNYLHLGTYTAYADKIVFVFFLSHLLESYLIYLCDAFFSYFFEFLEYWFLKGKCMDVSKTMDWKALDKIFKTKKETQQDFEIFMKISLGPQ